MSRTKTIILTAVVTAVATSAVWVAVLFMAFSYFGESAPFSVTIDAPQSARVGQEFPMRVVTKNMGDEATVLGSIDLYASLADGFDITKVSPFPREVMSVFEIKSYYFSEALPPGAEVTVTFTMKATRPGVWTGQVDSCTPGEKFASANVSIRVDE